MGAPRRVLWVGIALTLVGLTWFGWGFMMGVRELHLSHGERTQTGAEMAIALAVSGILAMISSRFMKGDP